MLSKLFTGLVVVLLLPVFVYSQGIPGPIDENAFMDLNQKRAQLNSSIPYLMTQIENLIIPDTFAINRAIESADYNVSYFAGKAKTQRPVPEGGVDSNKQAVEFFAHQDALLKDSLGRARSDIMIKKGLALRVDSAQRALSEVEFRINQIMIPKISQQNFLFYASLAFVFLMGILLFTFYKVVFKDQKVRFAVFGSDSGLQFVTLFSIIIAIILFGLTGILEGKELSALLGSIAGYILGKAKLTNEGNHLAIPAIGNGPGTGGGPAGGNVPVVGTGPVAGNNPAGANTHAGGNETAGGNTPAAANTPAAGNVVAAENGPATANTPAAENGPAAGIGIADNNAELNKDAAAGAHTPVGDKGQGD